jgi:hypothetical protein
MVGKVDYVEVSIEEFVVGGLLVFPIVINEPNAIQAIYSAVISDPENAPLIVLPHFSMWIFETHDRQRRDGNSPPLVTALCSFMCHSRRASSLPLDGYGERFWEKCETWEGKTW